MALLLIRHTEVAAAWRGRCYGHSDAGLSRAGTIHAKTIAPSLAAWQPDIVVHSGLRRARILARMIAGLAKVEVVANPLWQERNFGDWEGKSWFAIFRKTGSAMDGMIDAPDSFCPGGGETTIAMADRAAAAVAQLPAGRIAIVSHGGPIAALRGRAAGVAASGWPALVPACGESWEWHPRTAGPDNPGTGAPLQGE